MLQTHHPRAGWQSLLVSVLALIPLCASTPTHTSRVLLGTTWEALGPFPSGTREWPLSFPDTLLLTSDEPFHLLSFGNESISGHPSPLVDGGFARWNKFTADEDGSVNVAWPDVRWDALRISLGWATVQHQTLLRTELTIKEDDSSKLDSLIRISLSLTQGAEWAVFPFGPAADRAASAGVGEWHTGDAYSDGGDSRSPALLGHVVSLYPGRYTLVVRSVYDLRIKGDPHGASQGVNADSGVPVAGFRVAAEVVPDHDIKVINSMTVASDLLPYRTHYRSANMPPISRYIGITLRNLSPQTILVTQAYAPDDAVQLRFVSGGDIILRPGQVRPIALDVGKEAFLPQVGLDVVLSGSFLQKSGYSEQEGWSIRARVPFKRIKTDAPFRFTFLDADGSVQYAVALSPVDEADTSPLSFQNSPTPIKEAAPAPIVVVLHGAGVDVASSPWLSSAVQQQHHSWVLFPTGRTPWGFDWHGPSLVNVERAAEALSGEDGVWERWTQGGAGVWHRPDPGELVVLGHSNGGQGAWYFASRYPDRVRAVMPAAGYIKIQDYVPYFWNSHHFQPAALTSVLTASLTPYDNDLHLSNLFQTPLLARHGADDSNVPVHHSRQLVSIVKGWARGHSVARFEEVPGKDHWWDNVFRSSSAQCFLELHTSVSDVGSATDLADLQTFTLTVSNPAESGSLRGFKITQLAEGGMLARMKVRIWGGKAEVNTANVVGMSVSIAVDAMFSKLVIDGTDVPLDPMLAVAPSQALQLSRTTPLAQWTAARPAATTGRFGPLTSVLNSAGPLTIVVPEKNEGFERIASRLAHDLFVYLALDVRILDDAEALDPPTVGQLGNLVIIGGVLQNRFLATLQSQMQTAVRWQAPGTFTVGSRIFDEPGDGLIFQTPHPFDPHQMAVVLCGTDIRGVQHAARMFPYRTGVPAADWMVVGSAFEDGGVKSAGFWKADFSMGWSA